MGLSRRSIKKAWNVGISEGTGSWKKVRPKMAELNMHNAQAVQLEYVKPRGRRYEETPSLLDPEWFMTA